MLRSLWFVRDIGRSVKVHTRTNHKLSINHSGITILIRLPFFSSSLLCTKSTCPHRSRLLHPDHHLDTPVHSGMERGEPRIQAVHAGTGIKHIPELDYPEWSHVHLLGLSAPPLLQLPVSDSRLQLSREWALLTASDSQTTSRWYVGCTEL